MHVVSLSCKEKALPLLRNTLIGFEGSKKEIEHRSVNVRRG